MKKKFNSTLEAFLHWEKTTPTNLFFRQPKDGKIHEYTFQKAGDEIRRIAAALKSNGYEPGSKIALISKNCAQWIMSDLAIMMAGYVSVPLYPTLNADDITHILNHSESKAIFIGKLDEYIHQKKGVPSTVKKISFDFFGVEEGDKWSDLVKKHEPMKDDEIAEQKPENLLTLIYTSGTTGVPKGVMHTVKSFATVGNTLIGPTILGSLPSNPRFFSYLPLSHIAERIGIAGQGIWHGGTLSFAESIDTFPNDLANTQPHLFFAVPRIWAKFQEKILVKMPQKKLNLFLKIPILNNIVKKKIQTALGLNEAMLIGSGAAPIATSLVEWFEKLDIEVLQLYGMTEDAVQSHFNLPGAHKKGTVGRPLPGTNAKLSADGEILIKSDAVMSGYYKMPDITKETFTEDGFLRTGDMGEYDHDGYLTIVGRFKDQFKTDKGKYISPAPIELELLKNHDIEQICLVGTGIPQPICLITLSLEAQERSKESVAESLTASMAAINPTLAKHEKIAKMVIMSEDWSVDNGLLTPTLKTKRNAIEKIHRDRYQNWFGQKSKVIWE